MLGESGAERWGLLVDLIEQLCSWMSNVWVSTAMHGELFAQRQERAAEHVSRMIVRESGTGFSPRERISPPA